MCSSERKDNIHYLRFNKHKLTLWQKKKCYHQVEKMRTITIQACEMSHRDFSVSKMRNSLILFFVQVCAIEQFFFLSHWLPWPNAMEKNLIDFCFISPLNFFTLNNQSANNGIFMVGLNFFQGYNSSVTSYCLRIDNE